MTATTLLDYAARRGIALRADGPRLIVTGPDGTMTATLRGALAARKGELLALLATEAAPDPPGGPPREPQPSGGSNPHPEPEARPEPSQAVPDHTTDPGDPRDLSDIPEADRINALTLMFGGEPEVPPARWRDPVDQAARVRKRNVF
jgi:hypothetical protein